MSAECAEKGGLEGKKVTSVSVLAEADDDLPICWICLGHSEPDRPLTHPCRCPSWCHASCVARWQLQSAGTRRERYCDFCSCELPDWKSVLTPTLGPTAPAVMNVNFDNKTYSFQVAPGAEGYRQFTEAIRKAFHLPEDSELNITFTCDEPSSGSLLTLSGPGAYDAAVHCASVSAARRSTTGDSSSMHRLQHDGSMFDATGSPIGNSSNSAAGDHCPLLQDSSGEAHEAAAAAATAAGSHHHQTSDSGGSSSSSSVSGSGSVDGRSAASSPHRRASSSDAGSSSSAAADERLSRESRISSSSSSNLERSVVLQRRGSSPSSAASTSSRVSDAGSDSSTPDNITNSRWSNASHSAAGSSSSGSGSSSRRSQGFGRKLREAIADMLISK